MFYSTSSFSFSQISTIDASVCSHESYFAAMKSRKSPTQEHTSTSNHSETSQHGVSELNALNEPENQSCDMINEMINYHETLDVSNGKMNVDNYSDSKIHNTDSETHSTIPSTVPQQDNEAQRANSEKSMLKKRNMEQLMEEKSSTLSSREDVRESRKRKVKHDERKESANVNQWLCATTEMGHDVKVKILISNRPYIGDTSSFMNRPTSGSIDLGNDGNQHFCQVCRGFGDVVCCDGCPRVYHHNCIPLHSASRIALDDDEDPWFCPKCVEKKNKIPSTKDYKANGTEKLERSSSHRSCVNCEKIKGDLKIVPCFDCGAYMHFPSCTVNNGTKQEEVTKPVCHNCRVIDQDDDMEPDAWIKMNEKKKRAHNVPSDNDFSGADDEDSGQQYTVVKEKKEKNARASLMAPSAKKISEAEKKLKKKKKNRKRALSTADELETEEDEAARQQSIKDDPILQPRGSSTGVQAIPAFCFYLAENRWKIERSLSRKHRTFLRLPKGDERNALVAQEAAIWWTKLEPREHKLYINMSIRDFESRVVIWKEEKLAKLSLMDDNGAVDNEDDDSDLVDAKGKTMDYHHINEMYERLYCSTVVGSKLFKLEPDHNYNRVLLDLLHDQRFHPLPMLNINRPDIDGLLSEDYAKVTIPFFEVHGPVSTSIGDECLGCSRGWTHYCSVVQSRVPTVEHRAKLQPPLSSLLATRIGLGLRPRNEEVDEGIEPSTTANPALFEWRQSEAKTEIEGLINVSSCNIFDPKDRADDMVLFIEETVAMKVPEPPRPVNPEGIQKKSSVRALPTDRQREGQIEGDEEVGEHVMHNKCGRCRTMIPNDAGCVPCRRAQLVINRSKATPFAALKNNDGKSLKVHTTMLGRLHAKDGVGEAPTYSDQVVGEGMLKVRWCPAAILPPQKIYVPTPKVHDTTGDSEYESSEDVESKISDEESESGENHVAECPTPVAEAEYLLELARLSDQTTNGNNTNTEPPTKRMRPARSVSTIVKEPVVSEPDRPQLQKHYKKETAEIQKRITRIACLGILHAVMRRDPLRIFEEIVSSELNSTSSQTNLDLKRMRERLLSGGYDSLPAFVFDVRTICDTAIANNQPSTIYHKTARDILSTLTVMQARANTWMSTIKTELIKFLQRKEALDRPDEDIDEALDEDPFAELRKVQPQAVEMLENEEKLISLASSDFRRTSENETSFYGCLAIGRAAAAAEASLAQYPDSSGHHTVVPLRRYYEDEDLRDYIDKKVSEIEFPQLKNVSSWREELSLRLIRKVQKLRLERLQNVDIACSRITAYAQSNSNLRPLSHRVGNMLKAKTKKKSENSDACRVAKSRGLLATGLASAKTCQRILQRSKSHSIRDYSSYNSINDVCVSVRGSKIHGMGLFADQPFAKGDVVAEYVGEYLVSPVADQREKLNDEQRIQDYQFRVDDTFVIDATIRGSWARYINHSCTPNCKSVIIPGDESQPNLRRVLIVAKRNIDFNEELSYDYQFPLELDLSARIPCTCQSDNCRGFMNWDLPEKGSNNRVLLVHKRGANMRDRIRRLGRPLKKDEM